MFVVILSYEKPLAEVEKITPAHRAFLDEYYAKGLFLMSGRQSNQQGGVIVACCESREELEAILAQDPFTLEGIATHQIYEFTPVKYQPAFKPYIS